MNPLVLLAQALIRLYQLVVSPYLPHGCRYEPSCSHYAMAALSRHGFVVGAGLTVYRVMRCAPWGGSGYDPVPERPIFGRAGASRPTR